jgi:hypothetical protein
MSIIIYLINAIVHNVDGEQKREERRKAEKREEKKSRKRNVSV